MAFPGGETVIVGGYTVTWNAVTLGMMVGEQGVPTIRVTNKGKRIDSSDRYGNSLLSAIHLGLDLEAQMTCHEYRTGSLAALWPFGTLFALGIIGKTYDALASPLVLTAIAGTSAAATPASLTSALTILSPGYDGNLLFGPMVRTVPLRLSMLLALQAASVLGFGSQT